jgi:hypothetical protein
MDVQPNFRVAPIRSEAHLDYIRRCPCAVKSCWITPVSPHHVRTAANSGTAVKPGDEWCTPLCHTHHMELHQCGRSTFQTKYKIDLTELARGYAMVSRAMGLLLKEDKST